MKKIFSTLVMLIALLIFCQNLSFADTPFEKLARGLANTTTGWIEIFTTTAEHCDDRGPVGILTGIPSGLWRALLRTSSGLYETVTFPIPLPYDYEPIMEPEFVLDSALFE